MPKAKYRFNVFVNCPFDSHYRRLFDAIVFAVHDCGFIARCALEAQDTSQIRIEKIFSIVADCRFGIHDISRTGLDPATRLPRFNMPLELGISLAAKRFGGSRQKQKIALVLDRTQYRYQKFCSDIAGQDIEAHADSPKRAITAVRDWLRTNSPKGVQLPGASAMIARYRAFRGQLLELCRPFGLDPENLSFTDYVVRVEEWLKVNPSNVPP
jgi:hypothetical protein